MIARWALPGLLCLLLPSCSSLKLGQGKAVEGANPYELADNAGYSPGGFYGDPAAAGHATGGGTYPAEGQTFGGHEPGSSAGSYSSAAISDQAQIAPFSESGYSEPTSARSTTASAPKPTAKASSPSVPKPVASRAVASSPKKPSPAPTSAARRTQSRTTAGTPGGSVVKAVYHPPGSPASASAKKKATLHRFHTVKPGDTLSALASRYDVSVAAVKKQNHLPSDLIRVGQRLAID